jgi:hypothetical protein
MSDTPDIESRPSASRLPEPWRWGLYLAIIAFAAGQGWAQIRMATVKYSPDRWQEARPPHTPFFSANDRSRWCTVWSLAERGTWQIDEIITRPGWDTIDKVHVDGHFYSSKPPFVALLATPVYLTVRRITGNTLDSQLHDSAHAVLLLFNLLPWVLALVVLAGLLERFAQSEFARIFALLLAATGTFLTPFLITLNNHTPAAICLIFSLAPLCRLMTGPVHPLHFAIAGFFAASCTCCELPAAPWGVVAFAVACRAGWRPTLTCFVPAALIPLGIFLASNWQATGSLVPTYASFGAAENNPYHYIVGGIPSYWLNPSAIDRGESSPWVYLFHCTFGHHGIFSLTPIFLLSLLAWMTRSNYRDPISKFVLTSGLGLTIWVLVFYVSRTQSLNYGGVTSGLRWAFWLIPLWVLAIVPVLDRWQDSRILHVVAATLLGVSVFSITVPRDNPWQAPWLVPLWAQWFPPARQNSPPIEASPSWILSPPQLDEPQRPLVARYAALGTSGGVREFTLTFARSTATGPLLCRVEPLAALLPGVELPPAATLEFAFPAPFPSGPRETNSTSAQLNPPESNQAEGAADELVQKFFNGLPSNVTYRIDPRPRYIKTRLRDDAFECRLVSASVLHQAAPHLPQARYRRQVWWCTELPWGAVQIEDTVADAVDNSVIARSRWRLSAWPTQDEGPPSR